MFSPPILPFSCWSSWLWYLMHHCFFYAFFFIAPFKSCGYFLWTLTVNPNPLLASSFNLPL